MRRFAALAIIATLAVLPFHAKAEDQFGRSVSRAYCSGDFMCPNATPDVNMQFYKKLIDNANSCVSSSFGQTFPGGYFEATFPDYQGCFTTKLVTRSTKESSALIPKCCIVPKEGSPRTCNILCTLHEFR